MEGGIGAFAFLARVLGSFNIRPMVGVPMLPLGVPFSQTCDVRNGAWVELDLPYIERKKIKSLFTNVRCRTHMGITLEDQFVRAMDELARAGVDFDQVSKVTLRDAFGDSPFQALLPRGMSATQSPSELIRGFTTTFPASVVGTLVALIARRAMASLPSPKGLSQYHEYKLLLNELRELPSGESERAKERLLHDHREEDELDRLVGHKTD